MTYGQYHIFPRITGLKSDNARSSRSTPPVPRLYAVIMADCWIFCFVLPFPQLFALLPVHDTHVITPEIKISPFVFLHFFWHQLEENSLSYYFSLYQLTWIFWLRGHISMNSLRRSCQSKRCDPKHFWQHVYPKVHLYLDLSFFDKFRFYKGLLLHWLIPITCIRNELALHAWTAYMNDGRRKVPNDS